MISVERVVSLLEKKGQMTFGEIWKSLEGELNKDFNFEFDVNELKADLLLSMSKSEQLFLISKDKQKKWDLRRKYTLDSMKEMGAKILGEELEKIENLLED